jgi:hypothetical protein
MTYYTGEFKNGVVVLDCNPKIEEGQIVRVQVEEPARNPPRGSAEAILRHAGKWVGEEGEFERLLEEMKAEKQEQLRLLSKRPQPEL